VQGSSPGTGLSGWTQSCSATGCVPAAGTAAALYAGSGGYLLLGSSAPVGSANPAWTQVFSVDATGNGSFQGGVNGTSQSTTNGTAGVTGNETATTGQVYGVQGSTNSTTDNSAGISGYEGASTGNVSGVSGSTNSAAPNAQGVLGYEGATTGNVRGVSGYSNSTNGIGVFGGANATSGYADGVVGITESGDGVGGNFVNQSSSPTALVLQGQSGQNYSTVFTVDASGDGYYAGDLNVTGKLTKGSGSFKIDHPLDPGNKYLSHSFVESPDMMNVYNGNVTTDKRGFATVTLPDYFEALNRDFRYQLTVIGQFAQAIVAKKISANRFVIRTSKPNVEVSWQVTGIRQDAYANANRIPVEEDKPASERGYYLHPELFGQPESKSVAAAKRLPASPGANLAQLR